VPEPISRDRRYLPGLDGLRALAVAAVVVYHLGFGWASGGLLGVGVFFTLSGYLITDLLVAGLSCGRMRLTDFWLARARRLLPALFLMLAVVAVWVWVDDRSQLGTVRGQTLAALVYMSNWWQTFSHQSYFARFGPPSPLNHLWSLAVEEQFYVVWPWLLLLGMRFIPERSRLAAMRPRLAGVTLLLAAASAVEMALLYHPSFDPSRIYYGTDTRAFGLLFGAALALVWPSRSLGGRVGARAGDLLDLMGLVGLAGAGVLIWRTTEYSPFLYRGGMVLLSISTVMVIAAVVHPAARLGRWLGCTPLRWLGVRSYGIYLWHAPVIALTTPSAVHTVEPLRAVLQVGGSIALAAVSWRFVEEPIRHGAIGRVWARRRRLRFAVGSSSRARARGPQAALAGAGIAVVVAALALSGIVPSPKVTPVVTPLQEVAATGSSGTGAVGSGAGANRDPHGGGSAGRTGTGSAKAGANPGVGATRDPQPQTSCRQVVHIGDSTSEGMISSDYLPDPHQRLAAQYHRVGVHHITMEITGGTSIVETLPGDVDARSVARGLIQSGYSGCWVIALGTNDSADVYVGSNVSLSQRITEMMQTLHGQPVMWVNAKTLDSSGPYSEADMEKWNSALLAACRQYPNMRVYNWAAAAQKRWFIPDGIHYYSDGYAARAHLIADALTESFPAGSDAGAGTTSTTTSTATATASPCEVSTPTINLRVKDVHTQAPVR
jgi:peptidoglycan/LPS O-acetylase OafA/YrhL